ncbi:hypothetical protein PAXRUDRAFT_169128, partial [Paxillus rubicundulus Ve08.2h10]
LQNLAYKIIHSTTIVLPAWQCILKELKMSISLMPHDVLTHWNSTFDMLKYALKHRKAVDVVTQRRDLGLRKFELEHHEWVIILKDATLYFSCATPNLATVIPAMDHIDDHLTTLGCNKKCTVAIHAAVELAKKTLNRYYSLTDNSEVYRIAMSKSHIFVQSMSLLNQH